MTTVAQIAANLADRATAARAIKASGLVLTITLDLSTLDVIVDSFAACDAAISARDTQIHALQIMVRYLDGLTLREWLALRLIQWSAQKLGRSLSL